MCVGVVVRRCRCGEVCVWGGVCEVNVGRWVWRGVWGGGYGEWVKVCRGGCRCGEGCLVRCVCGGVSVGVGIGCEWEGGLGVERWCECGELGVV